MGCFSTPDWIHRLPDDLQSSEEMQAGDLPGMYIRPVFTRYSIADPHSFSSATQIIHIPDDASGTYYKIHTYEQWVRGEASRSIYGEKGKFERKGPWVLLKPLAVYHRSQGPVRMDSEESMRRCVASLSVKEAMHRLDIRKKFVERDPL
ncbi:MAG: hypothetical protein KDK37_19345, partial [Leptospiraceae bacterium]|nr:hypothetical protein [Leptospiraceae bacterium]